MSQFERAERGTVTVEDLLRLKQSERPAPEFWNQFERELRAKQLAAIIEKRPWWVTLRLPQAMRYAARFQALVGAAAVMALSLVAVPEYRFSINSSVHNISPAPVVSLLERASVSGNRERIAPMAPVYEAPLADEFDGKLVSAEAMSALPTEVPNIHTEANLPVASVERPVSVGPGGLMALIPWAVPGMAADSAKPRESLTLGELPLVHFASAAFPGREANFSSRVEVDSIIVSAPVIAKASAGGTAPVASMSPRDVRRNRILTGLIVADNVSETERSPLAQVREVLANALDDDGLYDGVRRLGMGGDRLTLKF
jgi:hypothetical protein